MARRKLENRDIRKLQQSNGSYYVTLPIEAVRALRFREGQKVVVTRRGKEIIIRDWK